MQKCLDIRDLMCNFAQKFKREARADPSTWLIGKGLGGVCGYAEII